MRHEGVVFKVYDKEFSGRMTYSVKLDGQPMYHRLGGNRFAGIAEPGNRIAFEATDNPDGKSTKVTGSVTLCAAPAPVAQTASVGGGYGGVDRQNNIVYQSSRKDSIAFLELVNATGALKLPAAPAAKLGALEAALDHYTALFFDDVGTLGAVVREAEGEKPVKAPVEAPAAEDDED